jgi:diacylglycerol kinase (ATP)
MSSKKKILFIINPVAGRRKRTNTGEMIRKYLDLEKYEPEIKYTEYQGHGAKLARKGIKQGVKIIVAVGGDGTVNEVASAVRDTEAALAIIPAGSGNGLARHMRLPMRQRQAFNVLNNHKEVKIDYGLINKVPFFCTCGVGFDAFVGARFAEDGKRGFITYVKATLAEYARYKPKKYTLTVGPRVVKKKAFLVTFANASQWGNNAFISPDADIQDGYLDICMLAPFPVIEAMGLGVRLFGKNIDESRYLDMVRSRHAILERNKPGPVHIDGEPGVMKRKLDISVVHKGIRLIVPENSKFL